MKKAFSTKLKTGRDHDGSGHVAQWRDRAPGRIDGCRAVSDDRPMGRTNALVLAAAAALPLAAHHVRAEPERAPPAKTGPASEAPGRPAAPRAAVTLDELYARLARSRDEAEAKGVAGLIERRLSRSGSDTADLLMSRSAAALEAEDAPLAVELLDRVTRLKPDWAEAWSRRAAAFFLLDDQADALADLHKALACEPRLYEAWAALGHIQLAAGNKPLALAAFRKARTLHPFLENVKEIIERLAPDIDGRDL